MRSWTWRQAPPAPLKLGLARLTLLASATAVGLVGLAPTHPIAEIAAPLTGHLIGLGLAAAVALLRRRRLVQTMLAGLILTFAAHAGLAHYRLATPLLAPSPPVAGLRILSLNTWHAHGDGADLARRLEASGADVLVLTEFGPSKRDVIARLADRFPHRASCAEQWECSVAILSRLPIRRGHAGRRSVDEPPVAGAEIDVAGEPVTVLATHLFRPTRNPWRHQRQLAALEARIADARGHVVVAGDFNTSPWSGGLRGFKRATGLADSGMLMPTWPAWPLVLPQVAIDHVLISRGLAFAGAALAAAVGSDHLPLVVDVIIRVPSGPPAAPVRLGSATL